MNGVGILPLFCPFQDAGTSLLAFQGNEVLQAFAVEVITASEVGGIALLPQEEQQAISDPFGETFNNHRFLRGRCIKRLPGMGQFVCRHRFEEGLWQQSFNVDGTLIIDTLKETKQVLMFGSYGGIGACEAARLPVQGNQSSTFYDVELWQEWYIQLEFLFQQGARFAIELFRLCRLYDGCPQTGSAAGGIATGALKDLAVFVQRYTANIAARTCFNARFTIFDGRIADKVKIAQDRYMADGTDRSLLAAGRADEYATHKCELQRWNVTLAATRHGSVTIRADDEVIVIKIKRAV